LYNSNHSRNNSPESNGYSQENTPLGSAIALLKQEQTYNPAATVENSGYVPTGSGQRMQSTLENYHTFTLGDESDSINSRAVLSIPIAEE
jgi:hypothetical protein